MRFSAPTPRSVASIGAPCLSAECPSVCRQTGQCRRPMERPTADKPADGLGYLAAVLRAGARRATRREATRLAGAAVAGTAFFATRLRAGARLAIARFFVVRFAAFLPDAFRALRTMVIDPAPGMRDDSSSVDHLIRRSPPFTPVTTPSRGAWPTFVDANRTRSPILGTRTSFDKGLI